MLKAVKLSTNAPQAQHLSLFVASLGVTNKLEIYSCENNVYINADIITPVLSVDLKWFHKNAESPTHYLRINKTTYINKYGMTKLLGQSKQEAAYKLQDYLYELFYKVETDGYVERDDLISRKKLMNLEENITLYKAIIENNQSTIEESQAATTTALNECHILETENAQLKDEICRLEQEIKDINEELSSTKAIATKLAKYVRVKSVKPPPEAYDDSLEVPDEEPTDPAELTAITDEAMNAKAKLQSTKKRVQKPTNKFYLMRSANKVDLHNYNWELTDAEPSEELKIRSEQFLIGDILLSPHSMILYRSLTLNEDKKNAITLFIDVIGGIFDVGTAEKLIH